MCGIVGYTGKNSAITPLIEGLRRLEYRGYDSAGVAVVSAGGELQRLRRLGKVKELSDADNRSTGFSASDLLANQGGILFFHRLKTAVDSRKLPAFIRDLEQDLLPSKSALTVLETDWDKEDIAELMSVFVALPFYQITVEPVRRR